MTSERRRLQVVLRSGLIVLVVAWLFSGTLRTWIPFWVPLVALAAFELEFVVRARARSAPGEPVGQPVRPGPGPEDADLGWGEVVEDEGGVRWVPPPPRPPRSSGRRLLATATAVAAVALVVAGIREDTTRTWQSLTPAARSMTEARLTREAARIAGGPIVLRCDQGYAFTGARSDALGVAFPRRALTYLHPAICRSLHDLLAGDTRERESTAEAIVVLAHEAVHLRGERREGVTECLAVQEGVRLGERLGLPAERAARMMRSRYLQALAERSVIRLEYRLPRSCADGGSLDQTPGSSRFP